MKTDKQKLYPRTADRQMNSGDFRPDLKVVPAIFANELEKEVEFYKWHYLNEKNKYSVISQSYNQARQLLFSMSQALTKLFQWVLSSSIKLVASSPGADLKGEVDKVLANYKDFKDSHAVTCQTCEHLGESPISGDNCEGCNDFSNYQMKVG